MFKFYLKIVLSFLLVVGYTRAVAICPPPGTYTIGPTGSYTSIGNVITDLASCGTLTGAYVFEFQSTYVSSVETFPINIPDFGGSATNTVTFRPQSGATGLVISSSNDSGTIKLYGAKYVYFDGRPGGVGTSQELTIENTNNFLYTSAAGATSSSDTVTVGSTVGLQVGMFVGVGPGGGFFGPNVKVATILSATKFTVTGTPTSILSGVGNVVTAGWSPAAVIFINGASNNKVTYCKLRSANQNVTSGTVFFSTAIGSVGNNYNTLSNNNIFDASSGFPLIGIYAEAFSTAGQFNNADTITNNNVYNYYKSTASSTGALLRCSSNWVISNNSFYQTASRSLAANNVQATGINVTGIIIPSNLVSSTNIGNNNLIEGNYVGGSTSNAGGTALTYTGAGAFVGIGIWAGNATKTIVQNNTIQNISYTSNGASVSPRAVAVFTGTVDCLNNLIGSQSVSNSIQFAINQSAIIASMINAGAANPTTGTIKIAKNIISGVLITSSTTANFRGISFQGSPTSFLVDSNTIEEIATASNIVVRGIWTSSTSTSNTISSNAIQDISQTSTGTSGQVEGIYTQGVGNFSIIGNTIYNLTSTSRYTAIPAVFGIEIASTGTANVIENNIINAIRATDNNASAVKVAGFYSTSASGGQFRKNRIFDLTNIHPSVSGLITGVFVNGGNWTVANNMITLANASNSNATQVIGILDQTRNTGARNYFYNSIYIGGNGLNDTYGAALQYNCGAGTANIRNNILVMERSKGAGVASFYSIANRSNNLTGLTCNNNIFNCAYPSSVGLYNTTDLSFADWKTTTLQDDKSFTGEYVPFVDVVTGDLHIDETDATLIANAYKSNIESTGFIVSTTDDYDNDSRPGPFGSVRGAAFAPDLGADEVDLTYSGNNVWLGISTVWSDPVNWSKGTPPTIIDSVTIPDGLTNYPFITGTANVRNISIIGTSAQLTIDSNAVLNLSGDYTSVGSIFNFGELVFTGSSLQSFPGDTGTVAAMYKLTANNSVGLRLNKSFGITGALTLSNGNIEVDNALITLHSDSATTARVAPVNGTFSYTGTGNFIVQRYIPARRSWRLMAAPIKPGGGFHTISEAWQERATGLDYRTPASTLSSIATDTISSGFATQITGGTAANGFDQSANNNSSIKYYSGGAWLNPSNTNSTSVNSEEGWMLFVRGDRKNFGQITNQYKTPTKTTFRPRGQLFTGTKTITSTGMTVVGNPYASALDFHTAIKTGDVTDQYYMWDPYLGGSFGLGAFVTLTWNGTDYTRSAPHVGPGTSLIDNRYIPSGAAVMVDFGSGGTLTFEESDKATVGKTVAFRPTRSIRTNLISVEADGNNFLSDAVISLFDEKFNNEVDKDDALKLANFSESFSLRRNGKLLSIEKRKLPVLSDTVFYNWGLMKIRNYQLEFFADSIHTDWVNITLEDNYLKKKVQLDASTISRYDFSLTNDPASYSVNRFDLVLDYVPPVLGEINLFPTQNGIKLNWKVENEYNVKEYLIERSNGETDFEIIGKSEALNNIAGSEYFWDNTTTTPGDYTYRIRAISKGVKEVVSNIKAIKFKKPNPDFYVAPNPASGQKVFFQLNQVPLDTYQVQLINTQGQMIFENSILHQTDIASYSISLQNLLPTGMYTLVLTSSKKEKRKVTFLYK